MKSQILLVDDDDYFRETYTEKLEREGYTVASAASPEEARARLDANETFDLVLVDEKYRGGPMQGADLAREIMDRTPEARVIIITAYADQESVRSGFEAGIYDYLEKSTVFETMLQIKVQNALETTRATHLTATTPSRLEKELRDFWIDARTASTTAKRGRALEETLARLFRTIPGFTSVKTRLSNQSEELDVLVRNESNDPFWVRRGNYLYIECKNWKKKAVGRPEIDVFAAKLRRRAAVSPTGVVVAMSGLSAPAADELRNLVREGLLIIALDSDALGEMIDSDDKNAWLKGRFDDAAALL